MDFFFFLIGFHGYDKPLSDIGHITCYCGNCHNQSAHAIRTITCITLFFIPVLPIYYSKKLKCSICGASGDLNKMAIERLQQGQPVAIG